MPAEPGLWIFVLGDMTIFGVFFVVFAHYLGEDRAELKASASALHQQIGAVNTLVLLASSYFMVRALHAYRAGSARLRADLGFVLVGGAVFLTAKVAEYALVVADGHRPGTELFFTLYFAVTGVHLLHVLIGMALVARWRAVSLRARPGRIFAEGVAVYWHMVDLLWVVIFNLVYLGATT